VNQRQGLRQRVIQAKGCRDGACDLRYFHRVRQSAAKVIGVAVREHLCLARQAPKGPSMDNPRPVALKRKTVGMSRFGMNPFDQHSIVRNCAPGGQMQR